MQMGVMVAEILHTHVINSNIVFNGRPNVSVFCCEKNEVLLDLQQWHLSKG